MNEFMTKTSIKLEQATRIRSKESSSQLIEKSEDNRKKGFLKKIKQKHAAEIKDFSRLNQLFDHHFQEQPVH